MSYRPKEYNYNLDLIRSVAVISVLGVHFFLNSEFYTYTLSGAKMHLQMIIRTAFMVCVPLFILLTGYLMNQKKLNKTYYKGIIHTIAVYLLACIFCIIADVLIFNKDYTIPNMVKGFFSFSAARYSWYINMYIGLFLFIPFLNIIWNNNNNKRYHTAIIIVSLLCTTLPSLTNSYGPNYWIGFYPVTYYFIGAYLKNYPIRMKLNHLIVIAFIAVILFGTFNFYYFRVFSNSLFQWDLLFTSWGGFENVIDSVLIFSALLQIKLNSSFIKNVLRKVSSLSLGIYLVSSIFDSLFYKYLLQLTSDQPDRLFLLPIIVASVFLCSFILSQIIEWIYRGLEYSVDKIILLKKKKNN